MKKNNEAGKQNDRPKFEKYWRLLEYLNFNTNEENTINQDELLRSDIGTFFQRRETFKKTISTMEEVMNCNQDGSIRDENEWVIVDRSFQGKYSEKNGRNTTMPKAIKDIYCNHIFTDNEVTAIINALHTSKAVEREYAEDIIKKLKGRLVSKFFKEPRYRLYMPEFTDSPQLADNLVVIQKAVSEGKKISFTFCYYNVKNELEQTNPNPTKISSYYIVSDHGRLYLIGAFENKQLCVYRIDLMKDIRILEENGHPVSAEAKHMIDDLPNKMNDEFKAKQLYMSYEKPLTVKLKNTKKNRDGTPNFTFIHDNFGDYYAVENSDKNIVRVRCSEFGILNFAMQYGEYVEILEPQELRDKAAERAQHLADKYSGKDSL